MSSLKDIIIDEDELNKELLAKTLDPYVKIGGKTGSVIPEEKMSELRSEDQVLVALLAIKAAKELGLRENERIGPTDLAEESGISEGTVYPKVRRLEDEGLLQKEAGKYWVPSHRIKKIKDRLEQNV